MSLERKTATTLDDVARKVGVSKYTVSAVLNSTRSNTRVSTETRQRILEAVSELQYRPNAIARSLRRRKTDLIGLYNGYEYIDARNRFLAEVVGGLQEACDRYAKDLLIFRIFRGYTAQRIFEELVDGRVDGLVLYAPPDDALAERLANSHLPVVAVTDAVPMLPSVVVDDEYGGFLQAKHLAGKGHRRVIYRGSPFNLRSVARRQQGFREAAERLGLTVIEMTTEGDPSKTEEPDELARTLLAMPPDRRPTAAVCWEDQHADRLVAEFSKLGLRVPEDIAVVGFNGLSTEREPAWKLTTIHAPWAAVGLTAVSLLMEQMEGKEVPSETVLPVALIIGKTT